MATPSRPSGFGPGSAKPTVPAAHSARKPSAAKSAARSARAATRARKKAERTEYRRFTVSTRQRRLTWTAGVGSVVALGVLVIIVTTSPLMSLRTIKVEGTIRLTNAQVIEQLQPLAGLPLARVSGADVARELSDVALIQSVDTRVELPDTLAVSIIERTPLGAVGTAGNFRVVDQAGVELWSDTVRPSELPLIGVAADSENRGFRAIVEALAVIPEEVLRRIDRITASSADTVAFSLRDSDHQVLWGSSEFSAQKARALPAALQAAGAAGAKLIDLSTPETVVIRDGSAG
jgi:cell division protein FtsQ